LCREIVDLVDVVIADDVGQRRLVEQVGRHELHAIDEVTDALVGSRRAAANDANDTVSLFDEQLGEI